MIKPLFQNVLVLVNGTEASINAVRYAILMAKLYRCRVYAVYVVDTATIKQLTLNRIFIEEEGTAYEQSLDENGRHYLSYISELGKEKGVTIETELRYGAVWSEIVASAEEKKADAILLGGYDKTMTDQKDMLSSTYRFILMNARCSVLMVKEKMIEQLYKLA
ncbi:universal stress protein [Brucepastera parasyntrophica]|uniref:universal stress protein n=1 Tax=Brucepastera parasyntrophica TaxID=2880008 RepID=UPI00210CF757|nr:universal stress protein [Brucepastera parasyntrophica]ULQ60349.1 universal stress protein [Brucepastera parasyntrophica]